MSGIRVVRVFVQERSSGSGPAHFDHFANVVNIVSVGLNLFQVLVGDTFLLYRMAIVWGRDPRFYVFPLVLLAASMGTH